MSESIPLSPQIALCQGCQRIGRCRLGLLSETDDGDGVLVTELSCDAENEGGPGVAHGGWVAGVMDELVGHVPLTQGYLAVTGTLTVRFVRPVPILRPLIARAWAQSREERKWSVQARLHLAGSGAELARAEAVMVLRDPGHFERHRAWLASQDEAAARRAAQ